MIDADLIMIFGVGFCFLSVALGYALDYLNKNKVIWSPIMMLMTVPVALGIGVVGLGYTDWGVMWWIGLFMVLFAVLLSIGGLWTALSFGRYRD